MATRREFLTSGAATVAAAALPTVTLPEMPVAPAPMRAWSFDIRHGDYRNVSAAAKHVGTNRQNLIYHINKSPELRRLVTKRK